MITDHIWIDDINAFDKLCKRWQRSSFIAIDTEFMRVSTFYPKLALIQINTDYDQCFLIDPLIIKSPPESFKELMESKRVVKVLHACMEDIEVIKQWCGSCPNAVFDTQIAYSLVKNELSISYQKLVKSTLSIDIAKGETRSDWMARPLSDKQINYAVIDVVYLPKIYKNLSAILTKKNRLSWVFEEYLYQIPEPVIDTDAYKRIKGAWQFSQKELSVLKHLAQWRENVAKFADIPRSFVFKDSVLIDIVRRQPETLQHLSSINDISSRSIRRFGNELLEQLSSALTIPVKQYFVPPLRPLSSSEQALTKKVKRFIRYQANHLQLSPEVLVRKKDLQALIQWPIKTIDESDRYFEVIERVSKEVFTSHELSELIGCLEGIKDIINPNNLAFDGSKNDPLSCYQLETNEGLRPLPNRLLGWRWQIVTQELIAIIIRYKNSTDKSELFKKASSDFLASSQQDLFES